MKRFETEEDLAKRLIEWLAAHQWTIYQEVQISTGGCCADIVAVQGPIAWIIETKQTLSMALLEQVYWWRRRNVSHFVSLATPSMRHMRGHDFAVATLKLMGIGWLKISPFAGDEYNPAVTETVKPRLVRKLAPMSDIRKRLVEDHKTFAAAGNANGAKVTPWTLTCRSIVLVVTREPGLALDDLIGKISHHYRSHQAARSCLYQWLRKGIIKGVESRKENGRIKVYPIEKTTAQT